MTPPLPMPSAPPCLRGSILIRTAAEVPAAIAQLAARRPVLPVNVRIIKEKGNRP